MLDRDRVTGIDRPWCAAAYAPELPNPVPELCTACVAACAADANDAEEATWCRAGKTAAMGLAVVVLLRVAVSPPCVAEPGAAEEGWESVEATSLLSYALRLRRDMVDLWNGSGEGVVKREDVLSRMQAR